MQALGEENSFEVVVHRVPLIGKQRFDTVVPVHVDGVAEQEHAFAFGAKAQQHGFLLIGDVGQHLVGGIGNRFVGKRQFCERAEIVTELLGADEAKTELVHQLLSLSLVVSFKIGSQSEIGKCLLTGDAVQADQYVA